MWLRLINAEASVGVVLLLLGCAGIGWEARRVWLVEQTRRSQVAAQAAREALGAARRVRTQQQREGRRERRRIEANARARQASALRAEREQALAAREQEAITRALKRHHMDQAATRWLTLDADALPAALETLFARRGLSLVLERASLHLPQVSAAESERFKVEGARDLLLTAASGARSVARCLLPNHLAQAVEVQELDLWRREVGAERSYLIALGGFSPAAVRLARSLPVTLVEAHLLAAWEELTDS